MVTNIQRATASAPEMEFLAWEWREFNEFPTRAITRSPQSLLESVEIVGAEADDRTRDWLDSQEFPTRRITYGIPPRPRRTAENSEKQPDALTRTHDAVLRGALVACRRAA